MIKNRIIKRAAFIDRDGVINEDKKYLYRWEEVEYIAGSVAALKKLTKDRYFIRPAYVAHDLLDGVKWWLNLHIYG